MDCDRTAVLSLVCVLFDVWSGFIVEFASRVHGLNQICRVKAYDKRHSERTKIRRPHRDSIDRALASSLRAKTRGAIFAYQVRGRLPSTEAGV